MSAYWINKDTRTFLERGYLEKGVTVEQRIRQIGETAQKILQDSCTEEHYKFNYDNYADKFEENMLKGWYSLSSPIWANFGLPRGLPISCNGSYISDSTSQILYKAMEIGMMTKYGSGTSAYLGHLRERGAIIATGGVAGGPVDYLPIYETITDRISQTGVRRGSLAVYLDVEHPDILEFLEMREEGHPVQSLSLGVCIGNAWMESMIAGDKSKRKIWARILKKRFESGYPYLFFKDNVNDNKPQIYKDLNMEIYASNLCTEICLPSSIKESFVCNLASMNLLHWNDWSQDSFEPTSILLHLQDAVMTEYIEKTKNIEFMSAAHEFAKNHRALGLGVLGWHSLLQSKMYPFDSAEAKWLNLDIFEFLQKATDDTSRIMGKRFGNAPLYNGVNGEYERNLTKMAIAPTTSSSFILGQVSQSIEPLNSNYFVKDLAKGKFTYKNPFLKERLKDLGHDNKDTWDSIMKKGGSVQHLDFLTDLEKDVFKTFGEINQREIIIQAIGRQKYIDQGQSLNLMIHPKTSPKEVSELLIFGWENGIKTFYYQRGTNPAQEFSRELLSCKSCES